MKLPIAAAWAGPVHRTAVIGGPRKADGPFVGNREIDHNRLLSGCEIAAPIATPTATAADVVNTTDTTAAAIGHVSMHPGMSDKFFIRGSPPWSDCCTTATSATVIGPISAAKQPTATAIADTHPRDCVHTSLQACASVTGTVTKARRSTRRVATARRSYACCIPKRRSRDRATEVTFGAAYFGTTPAARPTSQVNGGACACRIRWQLRVLLGIAVTLLRLSRMRLPIRRAGAGGCAERGGATER